MVCEPCCCRAAIKTGRTVFQAPVSCSRWTLDEWTPQREVQMHPVGRECGAGRRRWKREQQAHGRRQEGSITDATPAINRGHTGVQCRAAGPQGLWPLIWLPRLWCHRKRAVLCTAHQISAPCTARRRPDRSRRPGGRAALSIRDARPPGRKGRCLRASGGLWGLLGESTST